MMLTRCPGCAKPVEERDEVCPYCNRDFRAPVKKSQPPPEPSCYVPGTRSEALRSGPMPAVVEEQEHHSHAPFALGLLLAAAAMLWLAKAPLREMMAGMERRDARDQAPVASSPAKAPVAARPAPRQRLVQAPRKAARPASRQAAAGPALMAASAEREPRGTTTDWRIMGAVFDLVSLQPVEQVEMVFFDKGTGKRFPTETDAAGHYQAHLPANEQGYALMIRHPKYEPKYMQDDEGGSLRKMSQEERSQLARKFATAFEQRENYDASAGQIVERYFAIIPSQF